MGNSHLWGGGGYFGDGVSHKAENWWGLVPEFDFGALSTSNK